MTRIILAAALALLLCSDPAEACGRRHRRHREGGCGTSHGAIARPDCATCPAPGAAPECPEAAAAPAPGVRVQVAVPCATCEVGVAVRGHGRRLRR